MDGISLQQFLQARESASTRMQTGGPAKTTATTKTGGTDWQSVLEAKRRELGQPTATTASAPSRASSAYSSAQAIPSSDYKARAEQLRSQLAQGAPVRTMGNFLDMRA